MPQRRHVVRAAFTATAATACLALATPALAATVTHPDLRQAGKHLLASDKGFDQGLGKCTGEIQQKADEDIWVFVWPGNDVEGIDAVKIGWDTDDNGTADTFKTLADGHYTTDKGTYKIWFATPAGWKLETGESTIQGKVASYKDADDEGFFNLTHTCAGTKPSESPSPSPSASESPSPSPSTPGSGTPTPGGSENPSGTPGSPGSSVGGGNGGGTEGGLPLTGVAATSIALTGTALIGGGVLLMALRRRRDKIRFTS